MPALTAPHPAAPPAGSYTYSRWRHGGWYVHEVTYFSGAVGCVSREYRDRKWRIVCDPRPFERQPAFGTRDEAAAAEYELAAAEYRKILDGLRALVADPAAAEQDAYLAAYVLNTGDRHLNQRMDDRPAWYALRDRLADA